MANSINPWLIGKDITWTITPQDVAATGQLSDNAVGGIALDGKLDMADMAYETEEENISPMDSDQRNPVDVELGAMYNFSEILKAQAWSTGATGNKLQKAYLVSKYHKLVTVFKDHAASPATWQTETLYVKVSRYNPNFRKGKCVGQMTLSTVAIVTNAGGTTYLANPAYS